MKTNLTKLCAVILLAAQTVVLAQKTEVSVKKGKVIAETGTSSVAVDAGRKATLIPGKNPIVAVDDPLVNDLLEIYKWVEAEKHAQRVKIDTASIHVVKIEDEHLFTGAYLLETPNSKSELSDTCRIGPASILDQPKYYDLQGNLLEFDLEPVNTSSGYYSVHFAKPVEPSEKFRYICVSKVTSGEGVQKDGPLRHLRVGWNAVNCLNYCRFILPESAVFVESSRPVTMVDIVDGRVTVTTRAYTGSWADGAFHIGFLWPDKDDTTLADLPPQYRGLRDQREEEIVHEGRRRIAEISAGKKHEDQSAPLTTLLSLYSAAVHNDKKLLLNLMDPELREEVASQMDQAMGLAAHLVNYELLGTPSWPEEPANGEEHPVYLCRKGSLLCAGTLVFVYRNGKWYVRGLESGRTRTESHEGAGRKP